MPSEYGDQIRASDVRDEAAPKATEPALPAPITAPWPARHSAEGGPTDRDRFVRPEHASEITTQLPVTQWYPNGYVAPVPPAARRDPHAAAGQPVQLNEQRGGAPEPPTDTRAVDGLARVALRTQAKLPSQRGWRHLLYALTRINLGQSPDELYELELQSRVRRNTRDAYQIAVLGLKGGVGKSAVTVALGSSLSKVRGDRVLAIDADPDAGNLADRTGRQSAATIRDLLNGGELLRYNDIRGFTSMNSANLEVLPSEDYAAARREFNEDDWTSTLDIVSRYYNIVLADCGAGLFTPGTRAVLSTVCSLVIVTSASLDGVRQAAVTMDWLRQHGHHELLQRTCVVVNHVNPGKPNLDVGDLVAQFERHLPAGKVIVLPWDKHIASGAEIQFELLGTTFRRRILELSAALSEFFGAPNRPDGLGP